MQNRTALFFKRLVVMGSDSLRFYDQKFHKGLNVIYGKNSSGKTTILDFIYYILGGDVKNWREGAKKCSCVIAELEINGEVLTIRRDIDFLEREKRPSYIAWESLDVALSVGGSGWQKFSYSANSTISFSQIIFSALGIPDCRYGTSENASLCTMHNLLRLLYVDQLTPLGRIFQVDSWDSSDRREVVGDLLIGSYSDELYRIKSELRTCSEEKKDLSREKKIFLASAAKLGALLQPDQADHKIEKLDRKRAGLYALIDKANDIKRLSVANNPEEIKIATELGQIQEDLAWLHSRVNQARLELIDTNVFIQTLEDKALALKQSEGVRERLGQIEFAHCPCCMNKLPVPKEGLCSLCHQPYASDAKAFSLTRLKFELEQQIANAKVLREDNSSTYQELEVTLTETDSIRKSLQKKINFLAKNITEREKKCDAMLLEIGNLDAQIKQLEHDKEIASRFQELEFLLEAVKIKIATLESEEKILSATVNLRRNKALNKIANKIQELIEDDAGDTDLKEERGVGISFRDDAISVGGRMNFAASSMHYLRISFPIALLQAATIDKKFNHPLFTVIDSIEDKGLEKERIYALQRSMKTFADGDGKNTQIIFTTSDLLAELQSIDYQVGPYWTKENRTLNFNGISNIT